MTMKDDIMEPVREFLALGEAEEEESKGKIRLGESAGFPTEAFERRARRFEHIPESIRELLSHHSHSTWSSMNVLEVFRDNEILRQQVEYLRQRLSEIEQKLPEQKVITVREISRDQAKQEIRQLFESGQALYYSDIAEQLGIDLELVVDVCKELEDNGEIRVDESAL